jgi:phage recombination protein Bet
MQEPVPEPNKKESTAVTEAKINEYLHSFSLEKKLLPHEKEQFKRIAVEFQLNPFKREIYCVAYGEDQYRTCSIIVGYEVYIKRAERTGKLDGWKAWVEGNGDNLKAVIEIYRKDWQHPFTHEVYWNEAVQKKKSGEVTSFWTKMPRFQLRKVAISQGFRLCFPDELGGLPYDGAELGIEIPNDTEVNPQKPAEETTKPPANPATAPVQNKPTQTQPNTKPPASAKPNDLKKAGEAVIAAIGEILNSIHPEGYPLFSEDEKTDARQIVVSVRMNEAGVRELQGFRDFLSEERLKRVDNRKTA